MLREALSWTGIFSVLKFSEVVAWSWAWVLSPLWITATVMLVIAIGMSAVQQAKAASQQPGKLQVVH